MKRSLCSAWTVACLAVLCSSILEAGKPAPPPPPPPPDPATVYEWRPDLGGWLDTTRSLVWGYCFIDILGTSTHSGHALTHAQAMDKAANYADIFYDMAEVSLPAAAAETEAWADYQMEQGYAALAAGDEATAQRWFDAAEANYARAQADRDSIPLYLDAGDVASLYGNWRLPTQQEAQDAIWKGLFTYGEGAFNGYDGSPHVGFAIPWNVLTWTSTLSRNKQNAWAYRPLDGSNGFITLTSQANCIFVRTHVP